MTSQAKQLAAQFWASPTFMTWGSRLMRAGNLLVVFPLIINQFAPAESKLWFLFVSVFIIQSIGDLGFNFTFVRVLAYAQAGAGRHELHVFGDAHTLRPSAEANWSTTDAIYASMRVVYARLAGVIFVLMALLTLFMLKPISETPDPSTAGFAWGVVVLASVGIIYGQQYSAYLQGMNRVALLMRWDAITGLCTVLTSLLVLGLGGGVLGLTLSYQGWLLANAARNRWLCRQQDGGKMRGFTAQGLDPVVYQAVWPSAWKSGLGVFMALGVAQIANLVFEQFIAPERMAAYLIAYNLLQQANQFSQAPFYSKLPYFSRLRGEGDIPRLVSVSQRGMLLSLLVLVAGIIGLGMVGPVLLPLLKPEAPIAWVPDMLWLLMGCGLFAERFGAMHIQIYSTTNRIVWHIANGVTGIIFLLATVLLAWPLNLGLYAIPLAMLAGNLGFYTWYCARLSYRSLQSSFWVFEKRALFIPLFFLSGYAAAVWLWGGALHTPFQWLLNGFLSSL